MIVPVILCGGSGTRLWPASRENYPKQFLNLMGDRTQLQNTLLRAMRVAEVHASQVVTVTHESFAHDTAQQLSAIDPAAARHILSEPDARNTAAAVAYAAAYVEETFGRDAVMWVLPADHHIGDEAALGAALRHALGAADAGRLATFGIQPTRPETGYGYIRVGDTADGAVYAVNSFVEKPDLETARAYVAAGDYLWNSGMFLFTCGTVLDEFAALAPDTLFKVKNKMYAQIGNIPFDKAIMEKSAKIAVVPCNPGWSDIGTWESLWAARPADENGNVVAGDAVCVEAKNCFVQAHDRLIACAGVEDLVIVDTGDALLIADRKNSAAIGALVNTLKATGRTEIALPDTHRKTAA